MNQILIVAAVVVAWIVLRPLLRLALAHLFAGAVAKQALAGQPDSIHLVAAGPNAWQDRARAENAAQAFASQGFVDAGTWTVREMPGVVVALLVSPADSLTAAVYEHPKAGAWCELFYRNQDGTSATFTTARPTGLDDRPGHSTTRLTGGDPAALLSLARSRKPATWVAPVSAESAARSFEQACTEALAYRKSAGISRHEVLNVARNRAA